MNCLTRWTRVSLLASALLLTCLLAGCGVDNSTVEPENPDPPPAADPEIESPEPLEAPTP